MLRVTNTVRDRTAPDPKSTVWRVHWRQEHRGCGKRTVMELEEYLRKEEGFKKLAKAIAPDIMDD